jgi:hypothetical protein
MYINLTHFPKFVNRIRTFQFFIVYSQSQSLNTCKRVGVSSHIPTLMGTWGLSTISLGRVLFKKVKPKRGNAYGLEKQNLHIEF